jgi:hypothetical protein
MPGCAAAGVDDPVVVVAHDETLNEGWAARDSNPEPSA